MPSIRLRRSQLSFLGALALAFVLNLMISPQNWRSSAKTEARSCTHDDSGLKLPTGFCATVFAEDIGHTRHLAVSRAEWCTSIPSRGTTTTSTNRTREAFWLLCKTRPALAKRT